MGAAVLTVLLGVGWAQGGLRGLPPPALTLALSVSLGLYTAHLMDTFVDATRRGEVTPPDYPWYFRDSAGLIPAVRYPPLIGLSAALCVAFAVPAALEGGLPVAALLGGALGLALAYAPLADRHMLGVSLGYPAGVAAVLAAAFLTAGGQADSSFLVLVGAIVAALAGTKIRSDVIDLQDDRRALKRTVAVALGEKRAVLLGYSLALAGLGVASLIPLAFPVSRALALPPLASAAFVMATSRRVALSASFGMALALLGLLAGDVAILAVLPGPGPI